MELKDRPLFQIAGLKKYHNYYNPLYSYDNVVCDSVYAFVFAFITKN